MARPIKAGVDYFPHDTDTTGKKTLFTLESRFGNDGYAFWFKLLEILGTQEGLYFDCGNLSNWLFLVAKTRINEDTATEILDTLAQIEAIDSELWNEFKVVWVQKFADRLSVLYNKRTAETPPKPSFRRENPNISNNTAEKSTQRKVKESKGKESKDIIYMPGAEKSASGQQQTETQGIPTGEPDCGEPNRERTRDRGEPNRGEPTEEPVFKLPLADKTEYLIYRADVEHWAGLYPAVDIMQDLRNMLGWLEAKPKRKKTRRGIKAFITGWLAKTQDRGGTKGYGQSNGNDDKSGCTDDINASGIII